jgi:anti-anti-sigma regulatory factor
MHNGAIMSSEVRHRVDDGRPFPLVRLAGLLDATSVVTVRSVLLDALAGQPEALVVDVSDLEVADPSCVLVLRDVRRETAHWPAARLALCDTRTDIEIDGTGRDAALWRDTGWPVGHDSADIFAGLGAPHLGDRLSLALEPLVGAARRSREMITEACDRWGRPELAGSACIVVTELVNNVVSHSRTSMTVLLAVHDDGMSVAVRDRSQAVPTFTGAPAPTSYGGRGMLLIDSVASRWGSLVLTNGKVVWAQITAEPDGYPAAEDRHAAGMPGPDRG